MASKFHSIGPWASGSGISPPGPWARNWRWPSSRSCCTPRWLRRWETGSFSSAWCFETIWSPLSYICKSIAFKYRPKKVFKSEQTKTFYIIATSLANVIILYHHLANSCLGVRLKFIRLYFVNVFCIQISTKKSFQKQPRIIIFCNYKIFSECGKLIAFKYRSKIFSKAKQKNHL